MSILQTLQGSKLLTVALAGRYADDDDVARLTE